jgi:sugar phosphate isomerase/epimerase
VRTPKGPAIHLTQFASDTPPFNSLAAIASWAAELGFKGLQIPTWGLYHERIRMFHVKDAEFNPTGRQGVYGGYQSWIDRAGRFRSLGDGQVDFKAIFSRLAQYDYSGWAVLEWECCLKRPEDAAREGVKFITDHIINVTHRALLAIPSSAIQTG